jgi:hypothetical protein
MLHFMVATPRTTSHDALMRGEPHTFTPSPLTFSPLPPSPLPPFLLSSLPPSLPPPPCRCLLANAGAKNNFLFCIQKQRGSLLPMKCSFQNTTWVQFPVVTPLRESFLLRFCPTDFCVVTVGLAPSSSCLNLKTVVSSINAIQSYNSPAVV